MRSKLRLRLLFLCSFIVMSSSYIFSANHISTLCSTSLNDEPTSQTTSVPKVLFFGNSFTYGSQSNNAKFYDKTLITDNSFSSDGVTKAGPYGGVAGVFKGLTLQAGLNYDVYMQTISGASWQTHWNASHTFIDQVFDFVQMQGKSTLDDTDPAKPLGLNGNNPLVTVFIQYSKKLIDMWVAKNSSVVINMTSTWSRPDIVNQTVTSPSTVETNCLKLWGGTSHDKMAADIRTAYDLAKSSAGLKPDSLPFVNGIAPVGQAFARIVNSGAADPKPTSGVPSGGLIDLWAGDDYHASDYGYYVEALMDFAVITGFDPRDFGATCQVAKDIKVLDGTNAKNIVVKLQQAVYDEYMASSNLPPLKHFTITTVGTPKDAVSAATSYKCYQNYPNPFNPSTTIRYQIPSAGHVTISVYNILGNEVNVLVNEFKNSGDYDITFNASGLASGMYYYRINVNNYSETKKMIYIK